MQTGSGAEISLTNSKRPFFLFLLKEFFFLKSCLYQCTDPEACTSRLLTRVINLHRSALELVSEEYRPEVAARLKVLCGLSDSDLLILPLYPERTPLVHRDR